MAETTPNWFRKAWKAIDAYGNVRTIVQLLAAFGASNWLTSLLPGNWHPPQYWLTAGTAFFGAWLAALLITHGIRAVLNCARPVACSVEICGGTDVHLVFTNTGPVAAKFTGIGRLRETAMEFKRERPFTLGHLTDHPLKQGQVSPVMLARAYTGSGYAATEMWLIGDGDDVLDRWRLPGRHHPVDPDWGRIRLSIHVQSDPRMRAPLERQFEFRWLPLFQRFEAREIPPAVDAPRGRGRLWSLLRAWRNDRKVLA